MEGRRYGAGEKNTADRVRRKAGMAATGDEPGPARKGGKRRGVRGKEDETKRAMEMERHDGGSGQCGEVEQGKDRETRQERTAR